MKKSKGQRLKFFASGMVALAMTVSATSAQAFDHCQNYADTAVQQQGQNLTQGCGYQGWRWHGWHDGHYKWCKAVSLGKSQSETTKRAFKLAACRFN